MATVPQPRAVVDIAVRNAVFSLTGGAALNLAQQKLTLFDFCEERFN
jgi:hypothetical protein